MSTKKRTGEPPSDMVTPMVSLRDIGEMLGDRFDLPDGEYDVVIQYKLAGTMLDEKGEKYPALGVAMASFGLRPASNAKGGYRVAINRGHLGAAQTTPKSRPKKAAKKPSMRS